MPSSGDNPCASADGPPPMPLASAYESTAVMNPCPTNGPIIRSNNQKAREAISSRNSFPRIEGNLPGMPHHFTSRCGAGTLASSAETHLGVDAFAPPAPSTMLEQD